MRTDTRLAPYWELGLHAQGYPYLAPTKNCPLPVREYALSVPGVRLEEDGSLTGAMHALHAVMDEAGQTGWDMGPTLPQAPPLIAASVQLPQFQQRGMSFLHARLGEGVILNDDVGLGKTVQTIAALSAKPKGCFIVLCPAFLRTQWQSELKRWWPEASSYIILPPSKQRKKALPKPKPGEVRWVIAYYLDAEEAMQLVGNQPFFLVVDEIHNISGYKTQRLRSVHTAASFSQGRIGLTASLLHNDAAKLYPLLDITSPGQWGSFYAFAKRYASATEGQFGLVTGKLSYVDELKRRLLHVTLRRTRQDVAKELPFECKYQTVWLDFPDKVQGLRAALSGEHGYSQHIHQLAQAKVPPVAEQIKNDQASGIPSITFTWLREHASALSKEVHNSLLILGGQDSAGRLDKIQEYVQQCQTRGLAPQVIGTLDALGEGANLQWARTVNLASLNYTPDKLSQAIGRAARMGQTGDVQVRIFACKGTLDEHMARIAMEKLAEQTRLQGEEKSKTDLASALQLRPIQDALAELYERALQEEADGNAG